MNRLSKMKTIIFLITVTLSVALFTSCKDDDGGSEHAIVGTWLQVSSSKETFVNNVSSGIKQITVDATDFIKFTFNSNNTFTSVHSDKGGAETETGTYSMTGSKLALTYAKDDIDNFDFEIDGKLKLIFTEENTANNTRYVTTHLFDRQ